MKGKAYRLGLLRSYSNVMRACTNTHTHTHHSQPCRDTHRQTFAGDTVLAGAEENEQGQLRADEALAGPWRGGHGQVGHGVGCGVDPPQTATAQALATRYGLQPLQPGGREPIINRHQLKHPQYHLEMS